jgi:hypothetical protein
MSTISKTQRRELNRQAQQLASLFHDVHTRWLQVAGDALVLDVVDFFQRYPALASLGITLEAEYTDHGGYFDMITGCANVAESEPFEQDHVGDEDEIEEEWNDYLFDQGVTLVVARFVDDEQREATITRAQALELEADVATRLAGPS